MKKDKNGKKIKSGDYLYNDCDKYEYYQVISDEKGNLFLGDLGSPIHMFAPGVFWEIRNTDIAKNSVKKRLEQEKNLTNQ